MNLITYCPECGAYLNFDGDSNEWHCIACDYYEVERVRVTKKFRKDLD
jgi:tRNA(Ile2) C34 agmatinyltransferase TiaS